MQLVRWLVGAGVLALAGAVGCGGTGDDAESTTQAGGGDGHDGNGGKKECECKVTGGGVDFVVDDQRFTFGLNAVPREGEPDHGHITLQVHDGGEMFFGRVTDIVSCTPTFENGDVTGGTVTFEGFLEFVDDGEVPFTVTVVDVAEPGREDTIDFVGGEFDLEGPIELGQGGNIQFHTKPLIGDCPEPNGNGDK